MTFNLIFVWFLAIGSFHVGKPFSQNFKIFEVYQIWSHLKAETFQFMKLKKKSLYIVLLPRGEALKFPW